MLICLSCARTHNPGVYVYWLHFAKHLGYCHICGAKGMWVFVVGTQPDYYALPELVNVMRASKYALHDEIMQTPLLTMNEVFAKTKGE